MNRNRRREVGCGGWAAGKGRRMGRGKRETKRHVRNRGRVSKEGRNESEEEKGRYRRKKSGRSGAKRERERRIEGLPFFQSGKIFVLFLLPERSFFHERRRGAGDGGGVFRGVSMLVGLATLIAVLRCVIQQRG